MKAVLHLLLVAACFPVRGASAQGPGASPLSPFVYFVSPTGDDAGSGKLEAPWRTVQHALDQLHAGDTLVLFPGVYAERQIFANLRGQPGAPITIRGLPGAVTVIDGGFPQFRRENNAEDWELFDARRQIYRSRAVFPDAERVYGYFGPTDGGYQLVSYQSHAQLAADRQSYSDSAPYYCGPGVYWDPADERIYVRLVRGKLQRRLGYAVPADIDPRNTQLYLFPGKRVLWLEDSSHVLIEDVAFCHGEICVDVRAGAQDIAFRRCRMLAGRYEVVARGGRGLFFDRLTVDGRFPPWVARSDVKRPVAAAPADLMQGAALLLGGSVDHVVVTDCVFRGLFDGIDTTSKPTNMVVQYNLFETIRDDALEIATAGFRIDVHHNIVLEAAAGFSWNYTGEPPGHQRGTKWIHHNVVDTSRRQLFGRPGEPGALPDEWLGPNGDGLATARPIANHGAHQLRSADPWKIYYNTFVGVEDVDHGGLGVSYRFDAFDPAAPHEVYNNVLVLRADDHIVQHARVADGSQVFDGNVYHRQSSTAALDLLEDYTDGTLFLDFRDLAAFRASSYWLQSQSRYAPGWEAAGVEADPQLDALYRPLGSGPAGAGAVDLTARPWPGVLPYQPFRGAVLPR